MTTPPDINALLHANPVHGHIAGADAPPNAAAHAALLAKAAKAPTAEAAAGMKAHVASASVARPAPVPHIVDKTAAPVAPKLPNPPPSAVIQSRANEPKPVKREYAYQKLAADRAKR